MRFEQMAELQESGDIGHRPRPKIHAGEPAARLEVTNHLLPSRYNIYRTRSKMSCEDGPQKNNKSDRFYRLFK